MVRKDGMAIRRERIQGVIQLVLSKLAQVENDEIPLSKTIAFLEYEIGARPERLLEYLRVGVKTEKFVLEEDNDKIISMKKAFPEG